MVIEAGSTIAVFHHPCMSAELRHESAAIAEGHRKNPSVQSEKSAEYAADAGRGQG